MSLKFNGTTITNIIYNNTTLCKLIYNGTLAYENHNYGTWATDTAATCTAAGVSRRDCSRCDKYETEAIAPTGHNWSSPTYAWSGTSSCTATRACNNDASHLETSSATITSKVTTAATCTTKGTTTYTATFSDSWASSKTKTAQDVAIVSTAHSWNSPTYSGNGISSYTANRTCKHNTNHSETATATITSEITTPATCTTKGTTTYTANFSETWATDKTTTAQDVVINTSNHTGTGTKKVASATVCLAYTCCGATYDASHRYATSNASYSWSGSTCTATNTCLDCGYVLTETQTGTRQTVTAATCCSYETYRYYRSSWTNTAAFSGTRYSENLTGTSYNTSNHTNKKSYSAVAATCTTSGNYTYSYCSGCKKYYNASGAQTTWAKLVISAKGHTAGAAATCTTAQTCTVCEAVLVAAKGHALTCTTKYCDGTYKWECNNCSHSEIKSFGDAAVSLSITHTSPDTYKDVAPTCTTAGSTGGTFCNDCEAVLVAPTVIPATGHTEVIAEDIYYSDPTCTLQGLTPTMKCAVCDEILKNAEIIPATGHSYTNYVYDGNATCTADGTKTAECDNDCGVTKTVTATGTALGHAAGAEPTCTTAQFCTRCSALLKNARGHLFVEDVDGCYGNCTRCGENYCVAENNGSHTNGTAVVENKVEPTCVKKGSYDSVIYCTVCGMERSRTKMYIDTVDHVFPEDGVYGYHFPCNVCGLKYCDVNGGHTPGAAATCTTAQLCTACGATITAALGHKAGAAATCATAQVCTRCYITLAAATGNHSWSAWETDAAATCTKAGSQIRECTTCGKEEEGTIAATGHTAGAAATCTTAQTCTVCKATLVAAKGHTAGAAATCTTAQTCTVCSTVLTAATGHSYTSKVTTAATCTTKGVRTYTCSKCNASYTTSIAATGHTAGAAATCTTAQKCTVCKATLVAAKGHTAGAAATCTTAQTCTVCSTVLTAATGHTAGTAATCSKPQTCKTCGAVLAMATGNHVFATDAFTNYYLDCSGCGGNYCILKNLGHTYVNGTCSKCGTADPDYDSGGDTSDTSDTTQ